MPLQIIVSDEEHPVDPFGWQDGMALGAAGLCTLILLLGWSLVGLRKRQYPPLRSRTLRLSLLQSGFSLVHIWSTALSNNLLIGNSDGTASAEDLKAGTCVMLNYWLEFCVGLWGWITCLLLRMIIHGAVHHASMRKLTVLQVRRLCAAVAVTCYLPMLVICLGVQFMPGAVYFAQGTCHTQTVFKALLASMVALACLAVLGENRYLRPPSGDHQGATRAAFFSEYGALKDIGYLGVFVIIVNAFIAVAGLGSYAWGRAIFTGLVSCLHGFAFLRLYGFRLWKALRRDEAYVSYFLSTTSVYGQQPAGVEDLLELPSVLDQFIDFCRQTPSEGAKGDAVLDLFEHLRGWRTAGSGQGVRTPQTMAELVRLYVDEKGKHSVNVPIWVRGLLKDRCDLVIKSGVAEADPSLFEELFDWLLKDIDRRWSEPFFRSIVSERMMAMASEVELRALQQHHESQASLARRVNGIKRSSSDKQEEEGSEALIPFNGTAAHASVAFPEAVRPSIDMSQM